MDQVTIDLQNCYGIKALKHDFDFSHTHAHAIYAPYGAMKSSLAQTFKDASEGKVTGTLAGAVSEIEARNEVLRQRLFDTRGNSHFEFLPDESIDPRSSSAGIRDDLSRVLYKGRDNDELAVALSAAGLGLSFSGGSGAAELLGGTYRDVLREAGSLTDDFSASLAGIQTELEVARSRATEFGESLDLTLGEVPEEVRQIAEAMGGSFTQSLEQGRGVMEALEEAGRKAAGQLLHMLLQSEEVRGELGELADVIENVLNQALNGSIDSWEDLGRVALDVLQAIIEKMVEAQQAATQGSGDGGGIFGTILQLAGAAFGAFAGGGSTVGGSFGAGNTTGAGGAGFSYLGYGGPRASGGPVMPNNAFLVGEMGPELFVPKLPGHVIPNGALGGGGNTFITNIYAPGADAEGLGKVRDELLLHRQAIERVDRSVEPRAIAEVLRQADRGGNFARSVGRRPS
jgi:hypothetical protein